MFRTKTTLCLALLGATAELMAQTPASPAASPSPAAATPASPSVAERQSESAQKMQAAAELQKAAAQTQTTPVEKESFFSVGWSGPPMIPPPAAPPDCPPMAESEADPMIRASAKRYELNPALIKAVIQQESGYKPCAISDRGAMGLMQLMPETADLLKTKDPFDPGQNIEAGANYLKQMLTRFKGDLRLALAAYNAGPEKVDGPTPAVPDIAETQDYVDSITNALQGAPAEMPAKTNSTPAP